MNVIYQHRQKGGLVFYLCAAITVIIAVILFSINIKHPAVQIKNEILTQKLILKASNKMNRGTGLAPVNHGQDGRATEDKFILLESLIFCTLPPLVWAAISASSLTVIIDEKFLRVRFGGGLFRKKFPLNKIADCKPVKTDFWHGWGIHLYKNGWIYNIAGWNGVEITMSNGRKNCIGTDEPDVLCEVFKKFIQKQISL